MKSHWAPYFLRVYLITFAVFAMAAVILSHAPDAANDRRAVFYLVAGIGQILAGVVAGIATSERRQ